MPSTSASKEDEETPKKKINTIDNYFKKERTMELMISRMICKDGHTLSSFCTSLDTRYLFAKCGYKPPNSPNTIRSIILNFANTVKTEMIIEFEHLKKQNQKFSLTFDEWTSQRNHRYLNLNIHHKEKYFNFGLIRIRGSCNAEHTISLVKDRLISFGIDFDTDVVGITTDGASVMVKVGKLVSCYQQLCFAHGLQLAVVDILYKKKHNLVLEETIDSRFNESDDDEDPVDSSESTADMAVIISYPDFPDIEIVTKYSDLLSKVRKVVKLFKKSPTKNDTFLQKYIKEEKGKELSLILDCRTRWNSLLDMIERFYDLKVCIDKSLIDIQSDVKFTDEECSTMKVLIDCLQPFKLAVEALCRRDATLITAETILKFVFEKLDGINSILSVELAEALRDRIKERRSIVITGILIYLNNPNKYYSDMRLSDNTFPMPKKNLMRQEMKKILNQVITNDNEVEDVGPASDDSDSERLLSDNLSLKEQLEIKIQQEKKDFRKPLNRVLDYEKILKKEMSAYETEGVRGKYLSLIYDFLTSVKPTSVEAERAFSAAGYICSSLRSRLKDDTINTICFLRAYFQQDRGSVI
ncbi:uncharacterized protein LOC142985898 [Anticarsia gemmatalis]|uniref:uncharacterized protein LOC142985898 n=1 Tax=Anticarsia gemmatalis TaxID=129554 RepID=UPI003F75B2E0